MAEPEAETVPLATAGACVNHDTTPVLPRSGDLAATIHQSDPAVVPVPTSTIATPDGEMSGLTAYFSHTIAASSGGSHVKANVDAGGCGVDGVADADSLGMLGVGGGTLAAQPASSKQAGTTTTHRCIRMGSHYRPTGSAGRSVATAGHRLVIIPADIPGTVAR